MKATDIKDILWEVYTLDNWYCQKGIQPEIRKAHEVVLDMPIVEIDDIIKFTTELPEIIKLMIGFSPAQKDMLKYTFEKFKNIAQFQWGGNPKLLPNEVLNITALGVSKKSGAKELAEQLHVSLDEVLGVGDTINDWEFIEECGYAGAMGNSTTEFLDKVRTKLPERFYLGKPVNEDGVLDILDHFDHRGEIAYSA